MITRSLAFLSSLAIAAANDDVFHHLGTPSFTGAQALEFLEDFNSFQETAGLYEAMGAYTQQIFEAEAQSVWEEYLWETYWYGYESIRQKYPDVAPVTPTDQTFPTELVDFDSDEMEEIEQIFHSELFSSFNQEHLIRRESVRAAVAEANVPVETGEPQETGVAEETGVETGVETGAANETATGTVQTSPTGTAIDTDTEETETTDETTTEETETTDETTAETTDDTTTTGPTAAGNTTTADNAGARPGYYAAGGLAGAVALALF